MTTKAKKVNIGISIKSEHTVIVEWKTNGATDTKTAKALRPRKWNITGALRRYEEPPCSEIALAIDVAPSIHTHGCSCQADQELVWPKTVKLNQN